MSHGNGWDDKIHVGVSSPRTPHQPPPLSTLPLCLVLPSFPAHLLTTPYIPAFSLSLSTGFAWPRADRRRNQGGTASEGRRRGKRGNTIQPRGGGIINERTQWELRPDARSWANVLLLPLPCSPSFVKIGQALSSRPDLLPRDYLEALSGLQDRLPAFPTEIAFAGEGR